MRIQGMVDALNVAKEVKIVYLHDCSGGELILDEDIVMEVLTTCSPMQSGMQKVRWRLKQRSKGSFSICLYPMTDRIFRGSTGKCVGSVFQ